MENPCSQCGKPGAGARCAGCKEAPLIDGSTFAGPRYCDKACQMAHWLSHKAECKIHQNTKLQLALRRAVDLLDSFFLIWREACYDRPIIDIVPTQSAVDVFEDYHNAVKLVPGGRIYPFDSSLAQDEEIKKQVLCNMACDTFLAFFHNLNCLLLKDLVKNWKEVEIEVKGILRPVCIYDSVRGRTGLASHHLLKVQLKSGSFWAVDITAAQYGWKENLLPWSDYFSKRCENIIAINEMGERHQGFKKYVIQNPKFGDQDYRMMALWTHHMEARFERIVERQMKQLGIGIDTLLTARESRWTALQSALLLSVARQWQKEAKEADSTWASYEKDV